jgi:hypothetical protein
MRFFKDNICDILIFDQIVYRLSLRIVKETINIIETTYIMVLLLFSHWV